MEPIFKKVDNIQLTLEYVTNPALPIIRANVGTAGSGKSTYSCNLVNSDHNFVRVNRDDIRAMLFGFTKPDDHRVYYFQKDLGNREKIVSEVQNNIIRAALLSGKSVIVDSTNLKMKYINNLKQFGYPIELVIHKTSLEDCIERDSKRDRVVGKEIIEAQYKDFTNLIKLLGV
jgi:predicted kinase